MATEEPVVANEVAVEPAAPEPVMEEENNPPAKPVTSKKEPKAKKPAAPRKKTASVHPPYFEVIDNGACHVFSFFSFVNVCF